MDASPCEFKSRPGHQTFLKKQEKPTILLFDSYIQTVKNSVGSSLFRNFYMQINGKKIDVLEDGNLSCARFVSSILYIAKLVRDMHTTVLGAVADLEKSGWTKITKPGIGAILVWEAKKFKSGNVHKHIGFYVGNNRAISSRGERRQPIMHHWTFGVKNGRPIRKIEQIFWNKKLMN